MVQEGFHCRDSGLLREGKVGEGFRDMKLGTRRILKIVSLNSKLDKLEAKHTLPSLPQKSFSLLNGNDKVNF